MTLEGRTTSNDHQMITIEIQVMLTERYISCWYSELQIDTSD